MTTARRKRRPGRAGSAYTVMSQAEAARHLNMTQQSFARLEAFVWHKIRVRLLAALRQ